MTCLQLSLIDGAPLLVVCQIDKSGRVLDLEKNKSKVNVIEHEFKQAERIELWRQKEEQEMRVRPCSPQCRPCVSWCT